MYLPKTQTLPIHESVLQINMFLQTYRLFELSHSTNQIHQTLHRNLQNSTTVYIYSFKNSCSAGQLHQGVRYINPSSPCLRSPWSTSTLNLQNHGRKPSWSFSQKSWQWWPCVKVNKIIDNCNLCLLFHLYLAKILLESGQCVSQTNSRRCYEWTFKMSIVWIYGVCPGSKSPKLLCF